MPSTATYSAATYSDVPARLDRLPWSAFHRLVVTALGITWILDGLEVTLAGSVAAALQTSPRLHLTAEQVAKSYQSWANEVGTKAVERYKATLPQGGQVTTPVQQAAQKPSAMPRPTGDNPAPQSRRVREPSWDDVSKDVRSALTGQ